MTPMQKVDVLRAACCVAGIEGNIKDSEFRIIDRLADEVGVGKASLDAMIDRGKRDPEFHREQFKVLKADPQESMAILLEVALADGAITDRETSVLRALSEHLEVPANVFEQLIANCKQMENENDQAG